MFQMLTQHHAAKARGAKEREMGAAVDVDVVAAELKGAALGTISVSRMRRCKYSWRLVHLMIFSCPFAKHNAARKAMREKELREILLGALCRPARPRDTVLLFLAIFFKTVISVISINITSPITTILLNIYYAILYKSYYPLLLLPLLS